MIEHEVKVGAFILFSLALLIFVIMWLHKFDMSSYLHISARFEDVGTLNQGASVLYRGVKAGTIYGIEVSPDEEYVLANINITNKNVHIYEGSTATIVDKGFTGTKVLAINPPEDLKGKKRLQNGDIIDGSASFTFEELQKVLAKMSKNGTLQEMIDDSGDLIKNSKELTNKLDSLLTKTDPLLDKQNINKINRLLDNLLVLSSNLNSTSTNLNRIIGDTNFSNDLKTTVTSTQQAMNSIDKVANKSEKLVDKTSVTISNLDNTITNINQTTTHVDETINNPDLHGSLRDSMQKMSDILTDIKLITGDKDVSDSLKGTLKQSKKSMESVNCFSKELSDTLSKRFLLPRMILGKPGKNLRKCSTDTTTEPSKKDD